MSVQDYKQPFGERINLQEVLVDAYLMLRHFFEVAPDYQEPKEEDDF